jgi:branched-chain amino acid transport system ATP-binding protein
MELLDLFGLAHLADVQAGGLAYGPRKMVDIVRATISRPSILLLDEPSSGLDRAERARIGNMMLKIHREFQIPMMIVEHHMDLVRAVTHRVLGLASGSVALDGPTSEVLDSAEFRVTMMGDTSARDEKVATTDV